jgi:membrane protein implicated in regulation of membrane protease activity
MSAQAIWLTLAGILIVAELLSGTFYLLVFGVACLAGAMAAWLGFGLSVQLLMTAVLALLGAWGVTQMRQHFLERAVPLEITHPDIGKRVVVDAWLSATEVRVQYRGTFWQAELQAGTDAGLPLIIVATHNNNFILGNETII